MSKAKPATKPAEKVEIAAPAPAAPLTTEPAQASAPAVNDVSVPAPAATEAPSVPLTPEPAPAAMPLPQFVLGAPSPFDGTSGAHTNALDSSLFARSPVPAWPTEPLDDFLRRIEGAHIDRDVYAVAATHPEATARIWPGTYSGIRLSRGDVSVTYSDGSQA